MGAQRLVPSLFRRAGIATGLLVAAFAIFLGSFPQKDLDWEGTILPLAQQYGGGGGDVSDASSSFAQVPLQGKVIVITGCTSGIGLSLTRALSTLGATIVGIGRSEQRLARLQQELPNVTPVRADLTDLASVQQGANEILQQFDRIDMLINNAGMHDGFNNLLHLGNNKAAVSAQGYDRVFAVNYLSHFLLTEKLVPRLSQATKPTVLQISSTTHWSVDGSDLRVAATTEPTHTTHETATIMPVAARPGGSTGLIVFRSWRSYANSKLAQIYHARAWRQAHPDSNIRFVSSCPGWVGTHIAGGGIFHSIIQAGFDVNGFGIASPLVALLDYDAHNSTKNKNNSNKSRSTIDGSESTPTTTAPVDYYTNSRFFETINLAFGDKPIPAFFYKSTLRDHVAFIYSMLAIALQRIGMEPAPAISSPESYNMMIARELYNWSYRAVNEFL